MLKEMHILLAQIYCDLLPKMRDEAKKLGWAIAVHGSITRDFDLVAVPWTEDAYPEGELIYHLINYALDLSETDKLQAIGTREEKPHGRVAYAIPLGMGAYIDLSIIPTRLGEQ